VAAYGADGSDASALVAAAANVTQMALGYGSSGNADADDDDAAAACFPTLAAGPGGVPGDGPGPDAWGYQSCTETLHGFSARGPPPLGLRAYSFDYAASGAQPCDALFGAAGGSAAGQPDMRALTRRFGGCAQKLSCSFF
jgi:hypothetical protein